MNDTLNAFLTYFHLTDLLNVTSSTTAAELLVLIIIGFFSMVFCIVGVRLVLEIVKILLDYKRWV